MVTGVAPQRVWMTMSGKPWRPPTYTVYHLTETSRERAGWDLVMENRLQSEQL